MKKLLSIMMLFGLTATATTSVVSCGNPTSNNNNNNNNNDDDGNTTNNKHYSLNEVANLSTELSFPMDGFKNGDDIQTLIIAVINATFEVDSISTLTPQLNVFQDNEINPLPIKQFTKVGVTYTVKPIEGSKNFKGEFTFKLEKEGLKELLGQNKIYGDNVLGYKLENDNTKWLSMVYKNFPEIKDVKVSFNKTVKIGQDEYIGMDTTFTLTTGDQTEFIKENDSLTVSIEKRYKSFSKFLHDSQSVGLWSPQGIKADPQSIAKSIIKDLGSVGMEYVNVIFTDENLVIENAVDGKLASGTIMKLKNQNNDPVFGKVDEVITII